MVETPILSRYYRRYGIDTLRAMGFDATIWDMSPVLLPVAYNNIKTDLCDYKVFGFVQFYTMKEISKALKKLDENDTLLICSMGYRWGYRHVFQIITRKNLHYCYFMQELSPSDHVSTGKSRKWKEYNLKRIYNAVCRRIPWKYLGIRSADFIIGCGKNEKEIQYYKENRLCKTECPVIYFHSSNYEECREALQFPRMISDKYCVVIDQYLPYHPDNLDNGVLIDANRYYNGLNKLFDKIEEELGIDTVVAAHPRSNYNMHSECFPNRRVYKNLTCRLVKDCEFVIYHYSNSLAYTAVFNKPVLVVTSDDIMAMFSKKVDCILQLLKARPINMDHMEDFTISKHLAFDKEINQKYICEYMKKNYNGVVEGTPLWKQIGEYIMGLT